jgi:hypothetical protein
MTRVVKESKTDLMICASREAKRQIPQRYSDDSSGSVRLNVSSFIDNFESLVMFSNNYIVIGGYRQPIGGGKNTSGAFTYSSPLSTLGSANLIALSINTVDLANSDDDRVAAVIFHELLHNMGFSHTSNDPSSYNDRSVAILALEDCMNKEAAKKLSDF